MRFRLLIRAAFPISSKREALPTGSLLSLQRWWLLVLSLVHVSIELPIINDRYVYSSPYLVLRALYTCILPKVGNTMFLLCFRLFGSCVSFCYWTKF